jgi:hypothetical protein
MRAGQTPDNRPIRKWSGKERAGKLPKIKEDWLRGKDLNLRPLGYERAGQWLCSSLQGTSGTRKSLQEPSETGNGS